MLNAVARTGSVAWKYYQLKDEAQRLVLFGAGVSTGELQEEILNKAEELAVPLERQDIDVRREANRTVVNAFYTHPVEYFPNFTYPLDLSFSVEALGVRAPTADEVTR